MKIYSSKTCVFFVIILSSMSLLSEIIDNVDDKRMPWIPISDQVMGGISEVNFSEKEEGDISFYRMEGSVSTENNGGFIQFRSQVDIDDKSYKGLRIKTRGNGEEYFIHIRTPRTRLPWNYYSSSFKTSGEWQWIEIPFDSFKKTGALVPRKFKPSSIKTIGVVAYGKDFMAQVDVAGLELY